jgi:hypothetical protein
MADSATSNAIAALQKKVSDLEADIKILKREMEGRATKGDVQGQHAAHAIDISNVKDGLNRVEAKVQHILEPQETLAFIGKDDLRQIKTTLQQMIAVKADIDIVKKQIIDMMLAYDAGQANVIG